MTRIGIIIGAILFFSFTNVIEKTEFDYQGIAVEINSQNFLYKEINKNIYEDEKHIVTTTDFADQNDNVFASRVLDFSKSNTKPFYEFSDTRHGHYEKVEFENGKLKIKYRNSFDDDFELAEIQVPEPAVVDGGFTYFVKNNWSDLVAGKKLIFNFISVSRQDYFQFEVFVSDGQNDGTPNAILLQMQPHNFFLKALVNPIFVEYDKYNKTINSYKGISNIRDNEGEVFDAFLYYPVNR